MADPLQSNTEVSMYPFDFTLKTLEDGPQPNQLQ